MQAPTLSLLAAFREEISAPLVMFNITEQIQNLTALRDTISDLPPSTDRNNALMNVDSALTELMSIDAQIPSIMAQVVSEAIS